MMVFQQPYKSRRPGLSGLGDIDTNPDPILGGINGPDAGLITLFDGGSSSGSSPDAGLVLMVLLGLFAISEVY